MQVPSTGRGLTTQGGFEVGRVEEVVVLEVRACSVSLVRAQNALSVWRLKNAQDLAFLPMDVYDGVGLGEHTQSILCVLGKAAHPTLNDTPMSVLIEHALENLIVPAVEFDFPFLAEKLHAGKTGDLLEVEVLCDETAAQMQSAYETQGALAGASTSHQDQRGIGVEDALIRRSGLQGSFDGHDGVLFITLTG